MSTLTIAVAIIFSVPLLLSLYIIVDEIRKICNITGENNEDRIQS